MAKKHATLNQQIETFRNHGVTFIKMKESQARDFLTYNTYYYKLKTYENNYPKAATGENYQYVGVDISYLVELSLLDFALSRLVTSLCSNIEHGIKTDMNRLIMDCSDENIASECIHRFLAIRENFEIHDSPYTNGIQEQCHHHDYAPWHLWELLTLNDQILLYETLFQQVKHKELPGKHLLFIMRKMRNAVSHGNCLFADMSRSTTAISTSELAMPDIEVTEKAMNMCGRKPKISKRKSSFQTALDRLVVNNYAAVLLCHLHYVNSPRALLHACDEVDGFITRVNLHREEYFGSKGINHQRNPLINSTLNALIVLSQGYIEKAQDKARNVSSNDAYHDDTSGTSGLGD
ncbi:MAG: Abi family protein [Bifidobacterium thermacidophilum]|jgi:hypothetical protein|uniref:Abi family protein n=1 Tax=Bifidobacterium thermacidophilum TaxID=246618 RepID=UPI002F35E400